MTGTDTIVIGAGPIGIEVAAALKRTGIPYLHFEKKQIGATISRWPRDTRFFSAPERVAIAGIPVQTIEQEQLTGERYLAYLRSVVEILDLDIRTYEQVESISGSPGSFTVKTKTRTQTRIYSSSRIVMATGDMNEATVLGIPGEDLPHVTHFFEEPHRYFKRNVLIIGGRNSAVEAALRCFRSGANVAISYRKPFFDRAHVNSRLHLEMGILVRKNKIAFYPCSVPTGIDNKSVALAPTCDAAQIPDSVQADFVIFCTGFSIDLSLLHMIGAEFEEDGIPVIDEDTMETSVPGVYLAGTVVSGNRTSERQFIGTSHHHVTKIAAAISGGRKVPTNTVSGRAYPFTRKDLEIDKEQKTY